MKTPVQEIIDFVNGKDYDDLRPSVKKEWFDYFLNKEKNKTTDNCCVCGKDYNNPKKDSDTCYYCREVIFR